MDNSQVALHTSQAVKESLSRVSKEQSAIPKYQSSWTTCGDGKTVEAQSQNADDLHSDDVVNEDIRVACGSCSGGATTPPPLEALPKDEDVDREEQEVGAGEGGEACGDKGEFKASKEVRIEGGV